MNINVRARLADSGLRHSRAIALARRAYKRARARRDKRFWYEWEERNKTQMVSCAKMLVRVSTLQAGIKEGWKMWQENHS